MFRRCYRYECPFSADGNHGFENMTVRGFPVEGLASTDSVIRQTSRPGGLIYSNTDRHTFPMGLKARRVYAIKTDRSPFARDSMESRAFSEFGSRPLTNTVVLIDLLPNFQELMSFRVELVGCKRFSKVVRLVFSSTAYKGSRIFTGASSDCPVVL